jgi:hypothetical protein
LPPEILKLEEILPPGLPDAEVPPEVCQTARRAGVFSPGSISKGHSTLGADAHSGSSSFPVIAMSRSILTASMTYFC